MITLDKSDGFFPDLMWESFKELYMDIFWNHVNHMKMFIALN
jgi:hypothetical protein